MTPTTRRWTLSNKLSDWGRIQWNLLAHTLAVTAKSVVSRAKLAKPLVSFPDNAITGPDIGPVVTAFEGSIKGISQQRWVCELAIISNYQFAKTG